MNEIRTIKQGVIDSNLVKATNSNSFQSFIDRSLKSPGTVRVLMIDELGVTAELILHNASLCFSVNQTPDVELSCVGPVAMYYPEGVEPYNGTK